MVDNVGSRLCLTAHRRALQDSPSCQNTAGRPLMFGRTVLLSRPGAAQLLRPHLPPFRREIMHAGTLPTRQEQTNQGRDQEQKHIVSEIRAFLGTFNDGAAVSARGRKYPSMASLHVRWHRTPCAQQATSPTIWKSALDERHNSKKRSVPFLPERTTFITGFHKYAPSCRQITPAMHRTAP